MSISGFPASTVPALTPTSISLPRRLLTRDALVLRFDVVAQEPPTVTLTVTEDPPGAVVVVRADSCERTVALPAGADPERVEATFHDGALEIGVGLRPAEAISGRAAWPPSPGGAARRRGVRFARPDLIAG